MFLIMGIIWLSMKIVSGSSSLMLSTRLSEVTGFQMVHREIKRFPDGECYVRIHENLDNQEVILIQNTHPDWNIIEYLLLVDAIRQYNVKRLITVVPYFGYGRQDKRFNEGEPISAKIMAEHLSENVDKIITINLHNSEIIKWFKTEAIEIKAEIELAKYFEKFKPDLIISPDKGSIERAKFISGILGIPFHSFQKRRIDSERVEIETGDIDVKNKTVAIVDDVISTGGTIATAAALLKSKGASKVIVGCVHGLFVGNALQKMQMNVDILFSTDTVENEKSLVTVSHLISEYLK
ncbi:MAG: ribose-phosphate diphosphokinase [Euryarchaeota archaeon]|jgi:ribose-phosphate pyrophosphokinase|nr:ribose-phosphate diphosphokinase [Euryarchaeota archaeon]MVT14528.1 ribose-phosphate diphosphokinase [Euryarchaeota archaeon]MVT35855.1 ribose-phosphate diphosphokinase [Euryarchaeota archaeon]